MNKPIDAETVWRAYQRSIDYKRGLNLYDRVRTNEAFFLGRQWEGLSVKTLDPLIFNVLRRVVNLFVSMLVSDDVAVSAQPFCRPEDSERTQKVLDKALEAVIERTGMKSKNRYLLRNACVDGDGCFYIHFDPSIESGQKISGDLAIDLIDNTEVHFGNPASDDVQRQPFLMISMRRDIDEVRAEARGHGVREEIVQSIVTDAQQEHMFEEQQEDDRMVTVLLHMRRVKDGIAFCKTTQNAVIMPEKTAPYRLYPVAYMSWERVKNCCHGSSPLTEAIPNQIAINKLYSMYVQCIKQVAFPKIIYDATRFPNGYTSDVGKAIAMRGNPNEAILSAFQAPDISGQVMALLQQMMQDTMELMGVSDVTLGNVKPDNTSAIIAVQETTMAPLELVRLEFYRFVEDTVRIFLDLMRVHYGTRKLTVLGENGEETMSYDFSELDRQVMQLNVEVGTSAYWAETTQTVTNDNLLEKGIISDPLLYVENIPDSQIRGKSRLLRALREQRERGERNNSEEANNES